MTQAFAFLHHLAAFTLVAAIAVARRFRAMRETMGEGRVPSLVDIGGIRAILTLELAGVAAILLCAVLASDGIVF